MNTFRFSSGTKTGVVVGIILLTPFLLGSLAVAHFGMPLTASQATLILLSASVFGGFIAAGIWFYRKLEDTVTIDETGITYRSRKGPTTSIQWKDVTDVKARDYLCKLDIMNQEHCVMSLLYELDRFDELHTTIWDHVKNRLDHRSSQTAFIRGTSFKVWLALGILGLVILFAGTYIRGRLFPDIFSLLVFAGLFIAWILKAAQRVEIKQNGILINSLWTNTVVPFPEIKQIILNHQVTIETLSGNVIGLRGFKGRTFFLYHALQSARKAYSLAKSPVT